MYEKEPQWIRNSNILYKELKLFQIPIEHLHLRGNKTLSSWLPPSKIIYCPGKKMYFRKDKES